MKSRPDVLIWEHVNPEGGEMPIDFTVLDAAGGEFTLSDHYDAAAVITFHRGDF